MTPPDLNVDYSVETPDLVQRTNRKAAAFLAEHGAFDALVPLGKEALRPINRVDPGVKGRSIQTG
jgi:hypothetical protein